MSVTLTGLTHDYYQNAILSTGTSAPTGSTATGTGWSPNALTNAMDGGFNNSTNDLIAHWSLGDISTTAVNSSTYGSLLNGTYNSTYAVTYQPSILPGRPNDHSVFVTAGSTVYNAGGGIVVGNTTTLSRYSASNLAINAWIQVTASPTPYFCQGKNATFSTTGGVTTAAVSTSDLGGGNTGSGFGVGKLYNYVNNYSPTQPTNWVQITGAGIPPGTGISNVSVSGSTTYLTLTNVVNVSSSSVDVSVADRSLSFGRILNKGGEYEVIFQNTNTQNYLVQVFSQILDPSNFFSSLNDSVSQNDTYMVTVNVNVIFPSGQAELTVWANGVQIYSYVGTLASEAGHQSTNLSLFTAPTNNPTNNLFNIFAGYLQHVSLGMSQTPYATGLNQTYIQHLYVLGTQGDLYYDPSNPQYRFPAIVDGSNNYISAPKSAYAYPWETTLCPANPKRRNITIVNDSPVNVFLGLCYTDCTIAGLESGNTNPLRISLAIGNDGNTYKYRPQIGNGGFNAGGNLPRIYGSGIYLAPNGGSWSSAYYQGPISAITDQYAGYYNLTIMEDVSS